MTNQPLSDQEFPQGTDTDTTNILSQLPPNESPAGELVPQVKHWSPEEDQLLLQLDARIPRTEKGYKKHKQMEQLTSVFGQTKQQIQNRLQTLQRRKARLEKDTLKQAEENEQGRTNTQRKADGHSGSSNIGELKNGLLTEEEQKQILEFAFGRTKYRSRSALARSMNRSENTCKNFWHSNLKSVAEGSPTIEIAWARWKASDKQTKYKRKLDLRNRSFTTSSSSLSTSIASETTEPLTETSESEKQMRLDAGERRRKSSSSYGCDKSPFRASVIDAAATSTSLPFQYTDGAPAAIVKIAEPGLLTNPLSPIPRAYFEPLSVSSPVGIFDGDPFCLSSENEAQNIGDENTLDYEGFYRERAVERLSAREDFYSR